MLLEDLRFAIRAFAKAPGFSLAALVTLAFGIGSTTAIFSVVRAVLLRPLPYPNPKQIVLVWSENPARKWVTNPVYPEDYLAWRDQSRSFSVLSAFNDHSYNLAANGEPVEVPGLRVSANLFSLVGVEPELGRVFTVEEDRPGAAHVVVLSHAMWVERYGKDPQILGKQINLNGESYTVTGVMPARFSFPPPWNWDFKAELWVPLALPTAGDRSEGHNLLVIGRLKPQVTIAHAQAEMTGLAGRLAAAYPNYDAGWTATVVDFHEQLVGDLRPALLVLMAGVVMLLLIACANVANLVLARALKRQRELAIRIAVGAGRGRLIAQFLTESLLLALAGAVLGTALAIWGIPVLSLAYRQHDLVATASMDWQVLGFTLLVAIATGVVFGLAPVWLTRKQSLGESLKEGARAASESRRNRRSRGALVVSEFAMALVLLTASGLLLRSFVRLSQVSPGFEPRHVLTVEIPLVGSQYANDAQKARFFDELLPRIQALPGVEAASISTTVPLQGRMGMLFVTEENPSPPLEESPEANYQAIAADYFRAMGIPLLRGRVFNAQDTRDAPPVVIINENLARMYWPNKDPIGRHIRIEPDSGSPPWRTIVGVVGNVHAQFLDAGYDRETFVPYSQYPWMSSPRVLVIKTAPNPAALVSSVRRTVAQVDNAQPIGEVETMDDIVARSVADRTFSMILLGAFAVVALVLASIGIYSVMAYSVSQRTREISIRLTLGARPTDVLHLVISQGTRLALIGVAVGLGAALLLTRMMTSLLFAVSASDPATYLAVALLLAGVAVAACWAPARRAMRVDPIVTLRYE